MSSAGVETVHLTTIFTPPASCSSSWTYESSYYNSVSGGLLIQNALEETTDSNCFPSGFIGYGRLNTDMVFSPGWCPQGYTTPALFQAGATTTTTAVCCPSGFSYFTTITVVNFVGSTSVMFAGCLNEYPTGSVTSVTARANNTNLIGVTVTGPITMWAQPISIEYQKNDISLFTSTSSAAPSTTSTASPGASHTTPTQTTSSSGTSSPSSSTQSLSAGAKAGIGIGVAFGSLALLAGLALLIFLRKKRVKNMATQNPSNEAVEVSGEGIPREMSALKSPEPQHELPA